MDDVMCLPRTPIKTQETSQNGAQGSPTALVTNASVGHVEQPATFTHNELLQTPVS